MGWTAKDVALWVQGSVQQLQIEVEGALRAAGRGQSLPDGTFQAYSMPHDGRYTKALHDAFKEALQVLPSPAVAVESESLAAFDTQGPRALAAAFGIPDEQARAIEVAWAWWAYHYNPNKDATQAFAVITDYNAKLSSEGDQILQPGDTLAFVGDEPHAGVAGGGGKVKYVIGAVVLLGLGALVWKALRTPARMRLSEAWR